ncbi:hypothetical protein BKA93DRAFT_785116 [Sparassis latifolia]
MDNRAQPTVVTGPTNFNLPLTSPSIRLHSQHRQERPLSSRVSPVSSSGSSQDATDRQTQLEESLRRTVTLVFWYQANSEPIRLHQEISIFPFFQLSQFTQLIADLQLPSTAYVDTYNPDTRTWEQQALSAVRVVDSNQRLLYRTRRSLLEGLMDNECPGLADEVAMQPSALTTRLPPRVSIGKRSAAEIGPTLTPSPPAKCPRSESCQGYFTGVSQHSSPGNQACSASSSLTSSPTGSPTTTLGQQSPSDVPPAQQQALLTQHSAYVPTSGRHLLASRSPSTAQSPTSSDGAGASRFSGKRHWPTDFTVAEVHAGLRQMDAEVAAQPALTQSVAFARVFNCKYVKSTVCRHKAVWRSAGRDVLEAVGERTLWSEFVKRVEGRAGRRRAGGGAEHHEGHEAATVPVTIGIPMLVHVPPVEPGVKPRVSVEDPAVGPLGPPLPPNDIPGDTVTFTRRNTGDSPIFESFPSRTDDTSETPGALSAPLPANTSAATHPLAPR